MANLKLKLVLRVSVLVFTIVPALLIALFGTLKIFEYSSSNTLDSLAAVSLSQSAVANEILNGYVSDVSYAAKLEAIENNDGTAESILKTMSKRSSEIVDVLLLDASGIVIESATGSSSANDIFSYFDDDMNKTTAAYISCVDGSNIIISRAIVDSLSSQTIGHVCEVVSVDKIARALTSTTLCGTGRLVLGDKNGTLINFNGDGSVKKLADVTTDVNFQNSIKTICEKTAPMTAKQITPENRASKEVIGSYSVSYGTIPSSTNWLWFGIIESSALGGSFPMITSLIAVGALAVVMAIFVVLGSFLIQSIITPMTNMLKTMTAIKEDEEGARIRFDVKSKNEFGQIMSSFNTLLDEVVLSEERHRTIAELSDNMLFEWDFHKEKMYVSNNLLGKFDVNVGSATLSNGKFIDSLMEVEFADKYKKDINTLLKNKNGYSSEYQIKTKNGATIWASLRAQCITDRLGELLRVVGVLSDIDNEKKLELQLSERASYDFLSQLYNRSTFERNLTSEIELRANKPLAIMFFDVDDFKFINDRYGHSVGDEVIKFVADTIKNHAGETGFAGRFGGDEFVLCIKDSNDIDNVENIAMDIINELYDGYYSQLSNVTINVKCSIGISLCPEHTEKMMELLSFADAAMYYVKKNGKTNYHVYTNDDREGDEYFTPGE